MENWSHHDQMCHPSETGFASECLTERKWQSPMWEYLWDVGNKLPAHKYFFLLGQQDAGSDALLGAMPLKGKFKAQWAWFIYSHCLQSCDNCVGLGLSESAHTDQDRGGLSVAGGWRPRGCRCLVANCYRWVGVIREPGVEGLRMEVRRKMGLKKADRMLLKTKCSGIFWSQTIWFSSELCHWQCETLVVIVSSR